jgi:3-oxoadipyl-CoA thiolase
MPGPSVCVVGAGAAGLASALALARRGAGEVTVLEARHVAAGSSGLSVGIVETQYVRPLDIELRVRSMALFDVLEREHGLRVVRNGYLRLAHDADELAAFEQSARLQHELGVAYARVLDRAALARLVPDMAVDDLAGGLFGPRDGFIDGHLYCELLAELARARGARLLVGCELLEATPVAGGGWLLQTGAGELRCEYVVNAAGPWAGHVAALLGVALELVPQRHEAVVVQLPRELEYVMPSVMDYTPGSGAPGLYFRHERPGALIAGLHSEEALAETADPDDYARGAGTEFLETVAELLAARLPGLSAARLAQGWAGLYPVSPDGLPQVGPSPGRPTAIAAGGAGGSGIQLSPVIGELVADWILLGEPRTVGEAERLAPARFATAPRAYATGRSPAVESQRHAAPIPASLAPAGERRFDSPTGPTQVSIPAAPTDPVILAAVRTPVGRYGGALSGVRPDDLAALALRAAVERVPQLDPAQIEEVYLGCANQAGEDNRNVARMALLLAGLPQEIPGVTVNRLCASGLSAVVCACQAIRAGELEIAVAGGVESMSRAPLVAGKDAKPFARGDRTLYDTTLGWRFPNPRMAELFPLESMGETGENVAERWGVSREDQDAFALESQRRWAVADAAGRFADELVPVGECTRDEHPRPQSTPEALAKLRTVFREGGTVTAGNSSGVNDGAAALVIASAQTAERLGVKPLARFVGSAAAGVDPRVMGVGPIPAVRKLLARTGVKVGELDLVELNEAFASQSLAVIRELGLDPERVNVNGGAIALGHPLGMSGARLVVSLAHELRRRDGRLGLATLCVGVGQGQAALFARAAG